MPGGPSIPLSTLRAVLRGSEGDSVEQHASFVEGVATLTLEVPISGDSAVFSLALEAFDTEGAIAYATAQEITLHPGDNGTPELAPLIYAGPDASVVNLAITSGPLTLTTLGTAQLAVSGTTVDERTVSPIRVGWSSKNPTVADVDATGLVTAGSSPGTTMIVARTATGVSDSIVVNVHGLPVGIIVLSDPKQILIGEPAILSAKYVDVAGNQVGDAVATFATSTPRISEVIGDTLRGFATGIAHVVGTSSDKFTASIDVPILGSTPEMLVFGDAEMFTDTAFVLGSPGQSTLISNLIRFESSGFRSGRNGVMFYRGHKSLCASSGTCTLGNMRSMLSVLANNNFFAVDAPDSSGGLLEAPIDSAIKLLMLFTPTTPFTAKEIGVLKGFTFEGGRIVFVGESGDIYGASADVENPFLAAMGTEVRANRTSYSCGESKPPSIIPEASIRPGELTGDVTTLAIICASDMSVGANDTPLVYDAANTHVLIANTPVDVSGAFVPGAIRHRP